MMNKFTQVISSWGERRRNTPLRVIKVSRLQELLQYLAGNNNNSKMGNSTSNNSTSSGDNSSLNQDKGKKGFNWSINPTATKDMTPQPPSPTQDFIVKLSKILVAKSLADDSVDGITRSVFTRYVCKGCEPLGRRLFKYLIKHWSGKESAAPSPATHHHQHHHHQQQQQHTKKGHSKTTAEEDTKEDDNVLSNSAFISASNYMMTLLTDSQQMEFYIKVYADDKEKISKGDVFELISSSHQVSSSCSQRTCCLPDDILMAVVNGAMHGKESINTKYLHSWLCQHCPRLLMWLHRNVIHILSVGHRTIPDNTEESEDDRDTPILDCPGKSSCVTLHPALIWLLTCSLPLLYTKPEKNKPLPSSNNILLDPHVFIERMVTAVSPTHWVPLYNSDDHGLSINRLQHHVFGYRGGTLMFITTECDNMFCVASDQEWRDSKHFWGGEHARCLHLTPEYKIIESGPKILYFNVSSRGFPTGLQVGTDSTNRALTLDLNLTLVTYRRIPYKLHSLEVWGCSTTEVKEAQQEQKKREVKDVESRRKVKMNSSDWLDNPDRYLIELAGTRLSYAQYDNPSPQQQQQQSGTK